MTAEQFKPTLRKEADLDLSSALTHAIWNNLKRTDIFPFQNCLSCTRFTEATEMCSFWNAKPPARVIAFGCSKYIDQSEIPY